MTYTGPVRTSKEARRLGEKPAFTKKRVKNRERAKQARKARKANK